MYHPRFKGSHYEAGFNWGKVLYNNGTVLDKCLTFEITQDRIDFAKKCKTIYEKYFPNVLEEIKGIADGNHASLETIETILLTMYCFEFNNKCTCIAVNTKDETFFARNSDFLVSLEKLYMNCLYKLNDGYAFNGNTTAYVEMEDGVNEFGLAVGLTFVYPNISKPGLNSGMLIRYILENCKTVNEAKIQLKRIPIACAQTITLADKNGDIAVVECNCEKIVVINPESNKNFVATTNNFNSKEMQEYRNTVVDDWRSQDRYETAYNALTENNNKLDVDLVKSILSGDYGFMCKYDRKTNADTVWSVVYDIKRNEIWRVEGNPSRKKYKLDSRMSIN